MGRPANEQTSLWVLKRLREAGFQSLFAGGCVRDKLLGVASADFDVATDATPQQVADLFDHVLQIGVQFGVAMVVHHGHTVEVATFRRDAAYSDGRRPDDVSFSSAREDALRRDFTINGMFYDPIADEIIDYVGGQQDLAAKMIRTIGDPQERFSEDYLRLIRAVRFAARLDFQMDPATESAIRAHADRIMGVSGERIFEELRKMLSRATAAKASADLQRLGLAEHLLPELFDEPQRWADAMRRVEAVANCHDFELALAALLTGLDAPNIRRVARRWGASNELRDAMIWLSERLDDWRVAPDLPLCQFKRMVGHWQFNRLCLLWLSQEEAETGQTECHRRMRERLNTLDPLKIAPAPFVTGADLLAMGVAEGPELGRVLDEIYNAQLDERLEDRSEALCEARRLVGRAAGTSA